MMKKRCFLCQNKIEWIDYIDPEFLKYYLTDFNQIKPSNQTGLCRKHNQLVKKAIKRARQMNVIK